MSAFAAGTMWVPMHSWSGGLFGLFLDFQPLRYANYELTPTGSLIDRPRPGDGS